MEELKSFLKNDVDGYAYGYGDGSGSGDGSGYGDGSGSGDGSGYGYGCGYGDGDGAAYGSGYGSGYGAGSGSEYGAGSGNGSGSGSGDGSGSGSGAGYGADIVKFNNQSVYVIDGVQTIITNVRGNIAKGFILNSDLTLSETFIAKENDMFAHGSTIHEAFDSLREKLMVSLSEEERILKFKENFHDFSKEVSNKELFEWHHLLTGSCLQGRKSFAKDKNIDVENGSMTVSQFIELTKNYYGGDIIRKLIKN